MNDSSHLANFVSRDDLAPRRNGPRPVRGLRRVWTMDPFQEFLDEHRSYFQTDKERYAWGDYYWDVVWQRHQAPVELSAQARVVLAWRLTRLLAQHSDKLDPSDPLGRLPLAQWHIPTQKNVAEDLRVLPLQHHWPIATETGIWQSQIPEDYAHWLRPPPENEPKTRAAWLAFVRYLVDRFCMHQGVEEDPLLGAMGVKMLLGEETLGRYWPSPEVLQEFEANMLMSVLELLTGADRGEDEKRVRTSKGDRFEARRSMSRLGIVREIQESFNLSLPEATGVLKMSRKMAQEITRGNVEEDRAIMILSLEQVAEDARTALNLRERSAALKHLSHVQGLTRDNEHGGMEDVIDAIAEVSHEQREEDEARFLSWEEDDEND